MKDLNEEKKNFIAIVTQNGKVYAEGLDLLQN